MRRKSQEFSPLKPGQQSLRGAVREDSLDKEGQLPEKLAEWANHPPPRVVKQLPAGWTLDRGSCPQHVRWPGVGFSGSP